MINNHIRIGPIPQETALMLCEQIRSEHRQKWYSIAARWCWICIKRSQGDPLKMGITRKPGNRGCALVNSRYFQEN